MSFLTTTIKLLEFNTPYGYEHVMQGFLTNKLLEYGFVVDTDKEGNIYATRGEAEQYPMLNAHMDIVENYSYGVYGKYDYGYDTNYTKEWDKKTNTYTYSYHMKKKERRCSNCAYMYGCVMDLISGYDMEYVAAVNNLKQNDKSAISCKLYEEGDPEEEYEDVEDDVEEVNEIYKVSYDTKTQKISGSGERILGGDDKCGIAIALQVALEMRTMPLKLFFSTGEESGCLGVKSALKTNLEWFKDIKYAITIDRRGGDNLITDICSKYNGTPKFLALVAKQGLLSGIKVKCETGSLADTLYLREVITDCCNLSAGYYEPHTTTEYVKFDEMCRIKDWVKRIIKYV